jgi:hypothetical protein
MAQKADRFAYAVTDLKGDGAGWNALRMLNTQTGEYSEVLLNGTEVKTVAYDATTRKPVSEINHASQFAGQPAFSTGVAAIAYDRRNQRLYFTPMFIDQLRYIDLRTMKVFYVTDQPFSNIDNSKKDQGKIVTRMVITPDGTGYAITNDGDRFIQFTTGKKTVITDLGALIDDPASDGLSVHNSCTSFGGDIVADDNGHLYIVTATRRVFKVNIASKVATLVGTIKGLPVNFSVNGMVVNDAGKLMVSSAQNPDAYYLVDPADWKAEIYQTSSGIFRSSDMANGNVLFTKSSNRLKEISIVQNRDLDLDNHIQLYPNPVSHNTFAVRFNNLQVGNYRVELRDVMGRTILHQKVNVMGNDQSESININPASAKGVYMVQVINEKNKTIFSQKLVVQ